MNSQLKWLIVAVTLLATLTSRHGYAATITETFLDAGFAASHGWAASANNPGGGSAFGFSSTNNTGGTNGSGEAGGVFARVAAANYYADLTLGITYAKSDALAASGEIDITAISAGGADGNVAFGYFNSTTGNAQGFIGMVIAESATAGSTTAVRFRARAVFSDGTLVQGSALEVPLNSDRTFSFNYDPTGGVNSVGRIPATISGAGGGTSFIDFTAAQNSKAFSLDAFGFSQPAFVSPNSARNFTMFVDNVTYAAVPEPSSLAVLLIGLVFVPRAASGRIDRAK